MEAVFLMLPLQNSYLYIFDEKSLLKGKMDFQAKDFEKIGKQLFSQHPNLKKITFKGPSSFTAKYAQQLERTAVVQFSMTDLKIDLIN